ncbi:hypothetical protein [Geobacter sp. SVR]|uniref:hypothetical protein n=1 Tax=Geobacter sp. SVR TaxID=2495594 RepID=UPI00143F04C1|nr:hypothetical protein [Geobacter sp. SVR]BCS53454.1 hypothetical protein GSVR_17620 [Geobacter sp. SVR]GCF85419.1 hypothetical protein GSbR_20190 [Geobacter sp. SVR]
MNLEALKLELTNLTQEQQCWLATRNALRVLPMIAVDGERFPFWKQYAQGHLFSIFRAMNMALYLSTQWTEFEKRGIASLTTDITADSAYAAARNCELTSTSLLATHAASCAAAAAHASSLSSHAYAAAANSINYTGFNNLAERATAYKVFSADITSMKLNHGLPSWVDLWYGQQPDRILNFEKWLLHGLRSLGLSYWADEYSNWIVGNFNHEKMERSIFIPEETIKAGPQMMLEFLQERERDTGLNSKILPQNSWVDPTVQNLN